MKLYFLRHGEADWPDWQGPDAEKPLTPTGRKEIKRIAKYLRRHDLGVDAIVSSPLIRAAQTAAPVAAALELEVQLESRLAPGFNSTILAQMLLAFPDKDLLLVGHEPDFSRTIEALCGARVKMAKAGLARVDVDEPGLRGRLIWLVPPRFSAAGR